ncbi:MAG: hypothetical protein K6G15_05465 [Desulfovibrio sp.]|nr:hypothetical protein [Desulfovibrio sp.]
MSLHAVSGLNEKGELQLGNARETHSLHKGESMRFRCLLTESLPELCVVVRAPNRTAQWCPAESGRDGSLELAPFFVEGHGQ